MIFLTTGDSNMRYAVISVFTAGLLMASTAAVFAQGQVTPNPAIPASNATPSVASAQPAPAAAPLEQSADYKTALVCRTMAPPTGTRLGGRRVCLSQYDWDQQRLRAEANVANAELKDRHLQGN
jgi:hypothetical protein